MSKPVRLTGAEISTLDFRLAVEEDLGRLLEISITGVKANDGTYYGHQLHCTPEKYSALLPSRLKMYTRNDFFTCVVAELTLKEGTKLIVGYAVWGWFENCRLLDGDCPKPIDDPKFVPAISKRRIQEPHVWTPGGALTCWATHYLQIDPAYHGYYFEDDLIEWACRIADQEDITLGALNWPASLCETLVRSGFQKPVTRDYELPCLDGITRALGVVGMYRPPVFDGYGIGHGQHVEYGSEERVPGEFFEKWSAEDWALKDMLP